MKFTTLMLFFCVFCSFAGNSYSQNARVTINKSNTSLNEVLNEIESQTDYLFVYNSEINTGSRVSVKAKNNPTRDVLTKLFEDTDITYGMEGSNIVLTKKSPVSGSQEQQQAGKTVTGIVKDASGEILVGVYVTVKGTSVGVTTGIDGKFSIQVAGDESILVFSYLGYDKQEIRVGSRNQLDVTLSENNLLLDEIVVVGYGTAKKVNLSGAVEAISGKALESRPITNATLGLQGLISNVNISSNNGRATTAPDINIRGYTSLNGGGAFILIDNIPVSSSDLARMNPADIESISALKDASAAAIYGARAAFGVILVTTKKATSDKVKITFDANYASRTLGTVPDIITDPYIVMDIKHQAATPLYSLYPEGSAEKEYAKRRSADPSLPAAYINPSNPNEWLYCGSTDWLSEIYKSSAPSYTANLSISKKSDKLAYIVSGGYYQQDGMLRYGNDIYKRYNFRGKGTYDLTDWWQVGSNINAVITDYDSPNHMDGNFFTQVIRDGGGTLTVPKNPDGTWTQAGARGLGLLEEGGRRYNKWNETQLSFTTKFDLLKDVWTLNADATYRFANNTVESANLPVYYRTGPDQDMKTVWSNLGSTAFAQNQSISNRYIVYNAYTDFHKTFAEKHFVKTLVGFNQEYTYINDWNVKRDQLISTSLPSVNLATGTPSTSQSISELALRGVFGRFNYYYDERYLLELSGRYDGTSRYPKHNRFGFFPSGAASWIVSNESFLEDLRETLKVDMLKLRGSYGEIGNQVNSSYYPYIASMGSGKTSVILDGSQLLYINHPGVVAGDLSWETVRTLNFGVDLNLFKKLELEWSVYQRNTEGMLTKSKTLPGVFGATEPNTNAADLKTNGWELAVSWKDQFNLAGDPFSFTARFIISDSRSFITKYDNPTKSITDHYVGKEIGEIWGLTTEGFFQDEDELKNHADQKAVGEDDNKYMFYVGDMKYKDLNNDGFINYGD
ncbi:MAG: SusC/RagA family TonB-linked outer membrane protein, partial [Dysgonamonadaceae bacterium]|nr:SusC/RagA family TonB-linked outer membrane protein [Dysgonamonadaceae bacterium]